MWFKTKLFVLNLAFGYVVLNQKSTKWFKTVVLNHQTKHTLTVVVSKLFQDTTKIISRYYQSYFRILPKLFQESYFQILS